MNERVVTVGKALTVMLLAAIGAGVFDGGLKSFGGSADVGWGVFILSGAGFLYRAWFWKS